MRKSQQQQHFKKDHLVVLSSVLVISTRRELTPRRKTRSPPVRSWRHSNSRNSISRRFIRVSQLWNWTARSCEEEKHLELIKPEGIDHVDDIEKEVSCEAGQNQGLSGKSARRGKESFRRDTMHYAAIHLIRDLKNL